MGFVFDTFNCFTVNCFILVLHLILSLTGIQSSALSLNHTAGMWTIV